MVVKTEDTPRQVGGEGLQPGSRVNNSNNHSHDNDSNSKISNTKYDSNNNSNYYNFAEPPPTPRRQPILPLPPHAASTGWRNGRPHPRSRDSFARTMRSRSRLFINVGERNAIIPYPVRSALLQHAMYRYAEVRWG